MGRLAEGIMPTDMELMEWLEASEIELEQLELLSDIDAPSEKKLRFLRARKGDPAATRDSLETHLSWRAEVEPQNVTAAGLGIVASTGCWRFMGLGKGGQPILWAQTRRWNPEDYSSDEYGRLLGFMMERSQQMMQDTTQHIIIFDMTGYAMRYATYINHVRVCVDVGQNQYPERALKVFVLNAPFMFSAMWSIINPLLDEKTASKVTFLSGTAAISDALLELVHAEDLVDLYGGQRPAAEVPCFNVPGHENIQELSDEELIAKGLTP